MDKGGEKNLINGTSVSNDIQKRKKHSADSRWRRGKTLALCGGFLGLGMAASIFGPTLLDFGCSLYVSLEMMTWVFTARSLGYLVGSLVGGIFIDRFNVCLLLGICYLLLGIGYVTLPWLGNFIALLCLVIILGLCMGTVDTGSNVLLLRLWKKDNGPYMQLIHFLFGFGSFIAPLLLTPFAAGTHPCFKSTMHATSSDGNATFNATFSPPESNGTHTVTSISPVRFAFSAVGASIALISVPFFVFTCSDRRVSGSTKHEAHDEKKVDSDLLKKERNYRRLLLVLLFVFYMLYTGMETAYGGLVASFAATSSSLKFDPPTAAFLTSVFWGVFSLGRLLGIPIAHYVTSAVIIGVSLGIGTASSLILATLSESHVIVLWIFTGILGLGMATIFPAGFTWAGSKIHIEGTSAAVPVVGSSLGDMLLPAVIGVMMERVSPRMLMWTSLTTTSLSIVVFASLLFLTSRHKFILEPVPNDAQHNGDVKSPEEDDNDEPASSVYLHPLAL